MLRSTSAFADTFYQGYPEVQGIKALQFVSDPDKVARLTRNLDKLYEPTQEQHDEINRTMREFQSEAGARLQELKNQGFRSGNEEFDDIRHRAYRPMVYTCPSLASDTSAGILELIANAEKPLPVVIDIEFVGNGLFCEWAYVVDLDAGVLEVYEGKNETESRIGGTRFEHLKGMESRNGAGPELRGSWKFSNLPSEEAFLDECNMTEEEQDGVDGPGLRIP